MSVSFEKLLVIEALVEVVTTNFFAPADVDTLDVDVVLEGLRHLVFTCVFDHSAKD